MNANDHQRLIRSLSKPGIWPHPVASVEVVNTHISSVLICGDFVYKIKKPVDFGFLNYSTLARRRHFCELEVVLNRRLAPSIYLGITEITGSIGHPHVNGQGEAIEYAVKMRRFDRQLELDRLIEQNRLDDANIESLARRIADFHTSIQTADSQSRFGDPDAVMLPMQQNFDQIADTVSSVAQRKQLQHIEHWTRQQHQRLRDTLAARKTNGFIRECHGDMHLGNIALHGGKVLIFDGIEFNDDLRWIDVFSEIAFITMDLHEKGRPDLASLLLNHYLEHTGDYAGLAVLRFYQVYRSLVRAKVAALGIAQYSEPAQRRSLLQDCQAYIDMAERYTEPVQPLLILMAGYSATGKSTLSRELLKALGWIRIRSDRERKRLFGAAQDVKQEINEGIYRPDLTKQTYQHLLTQAESILRAGLSVIVDATFLKQSQRHPFQQLAQARDCRYRVLWLDAKLETLVQRLDRRSNQPGNISDASAAVIRQQQKTAERPTGDEPSLLLDTEQPMDLAALVDSLRELDD